MDFPTLPTSSWYCDECGHGPMTFGLDRNCVNCGATYTRNSNQLEPKGDQGQKNYDPNSLGESRRVKLEQLRRLAQGREAKVAGRLDATLPGTALETSNSSSLAAQPEARQGGGEGQLCCSCGEFQNGVVFQCLNCGHTNCQDCKWDEWVIFQDSPDRSLGDSNVAYWKNWPQSIPLPNQLPSKRDYLRNPRSYTSELGHVKRTVYQMSPLIQSLSGGLRNSADEPRDILELTSLEAEYPMYFSHLRWTRLGQGVSSAATLPSLFENLLRTRNRIIRVCHMIFYMKAAGLIKDRISILVRHPSDIAVAQLLPIMVVRVFDLLAILQQCLEDCLCPGLEIRVTKNIIRTATLSCDEMLCSLKHPTIQTQANLTGNHPQ